MLTHKCLGRFSIPLEVINDDVDVAHVILSEVVVIDADYDLATNEIKYTAISDAFAEVDAGSQPPIYDVEFDAETSSVTWTRT